MGKSCRNEECDDWSIKAADHPRNCRKGIVDSCNKFTDVAIETDPVVNVLCSDLVRRIEANNFECIAGALKNCVEWVELKALILEDN